jgi:hypothetical protein
MTVVFSLASIFQVKPGLSYGEIEGVIMPWKTIIGYSW